MPGQPSRTIDFVVGKLLSAIRQVMVMRNEESRSVEFSFTSKRLRLSAQVNDGKKKDVFDESHIDIDCEYSGEPMKIKFDPVYFSDVLKVLDSGSIVSLALISTEDPGLLTSGRFQYVIMPVAKD
jgi:DNA polymerase III sliding clamp (beta) subunit (PCNA family)